MHRAFPRPSGGADEHGGNVAGFEELVIADPSLQIKAGVQWGLFGSAVIHLGTAEHHAEVAARHHEPGHPRLLRHDRDRARLRRRQHRHHRHVRPGHRGIRGPHAVPGRLEGLHRQRRHGRPRRRGLRPAGHAGRQPRRPRLLRGPPRPRDQGIPAGHRRRGRRRQGRPERHRQRPAALHQRPDPAHQPAEPLRRRRRRRHLQLPHRQPGPPLLHHARHPGPGPRLARRRRRGRVEAGPEDRHPVRHRTPPVQRLLADRRGSAAGLPAAPAPAVHPPGHHLRRRLRPRAAAAEVRRRLLRPRTTRTRTARTWKPSPRRSSRSAPGTPWTPCRNAARPAAAPAS